MVLRKNKCNEVTIIVMATEISNYAFISYSHQDSKIARWLQNKLEQYYIPTKIYEKIRPENRPKDGMRYLRPIFLDKTDLAAGILADTLRQNLEASRYLIVICSPNSAQSEWVSKEVQTFIDNGRLDYIIPFVIDGVPYKEAQIAAGKNPEGEECMPKSLVEFTRKHPEMELLGVDFKADGPDASAVRIISQMLGLNFDDLWNRQARRSRTRFAYTISGIVAILLVVGFFFLPMRLTYTIINNDASTGLPVPDDAMVTIEGVEYFLGSRLDTTLTLKTRPGYYRGRKLPVQFQSSYYDTIMTEFDLGYGFSSNASLYVKRNNEFAIFAGKVIDEEGDPLPGAKVTVRQSTSTTDSNGRFEIILPPAEQAEEQAIIIEKAGYYDVFRPDECASADLIYVMHGKDTD